jgi:hypothetical protein
MLDIMTELFKWDQDLFLQNIFLSLDTSTLRRCRQVSQVWQGFIDSRVFGCKRLKPNLIERLWKDFQPIEQEVVVAGSVTSIVCDDEVIVCGYSDGACGVFSCDTKAYVTTISDKQEDIHYSSSKAILGKVIIAKISYGCDQEGRNGKCSIGIWMKTGFKKIYSTVLESEKDCVYLQEHLNSVFIW